MPSFADQIWEDAAAPLLDELHGVAVTYSRGLRAVDITAVPSVLSHEVYDQDDGALSTVATLRQYVIAASAIVLDGETVEPQLRDRITETINGATQTYEVSPVPGKPAYELQVSGARWLVRCKRVD